MKLLLELRSVTWRKIESRVVKFLESFSNINVVELGSGTGFMALLMALKGYDDTLVDYSELALRRAKETLVISVLIPSLLKLMCYSLARNYFSRFDVSLSFGLVNIQWEYNVSKSSCAP